MTLEAASPISSFGPAERLSAEWACVKLVYEFARLIDSRQMDLLVGLFDDDAEFNRPSEPHRIVKGKQDLLADFRSRPNYVSAHLFSNVHVRAERPERAVGHSYLMMYTGDPNNVGQLNVPIANTGSRIGAFTEEFVCRDGIWLFKRRVGRMLLVVQPKNVR
jgi:hypothetical protein